MALAACTSGGDKVDAGPCAPHGEQGPEGYCVYTGPIIVTGFLCPESHPYQYEAGDYVVCAEEGGELDAPMLEWLEAQGVATGDEPITPVACGDQPCTEDEAVEKVDRTLFIVDMSASLLCASDFDVYRAALDATISSVLEQGGGDEVAVIAVDAVPVVVPFSSDAAAIGEALPQELGSASDLQGALAAAAGLIEQELSSMEPDTLAATRLRVVVIASGPPEPLCQEGCGNDALYGVCDTSQEIPADIYIDFGGDCGAYNTLSQLTDKVAALLASAEGTSEATVHTRWWLGSVEEAIDRCSIEGSDPLIRDWAYGLEVAAALATAGGGTFVQLDPATTSEIPLP